MSTILHLSDLHLGAGQPWERKTDDKVGIVPRDENSRLSVIETSLRGVRNQLRERDEELSAVVLSGDLTTGNDPEGFKRLTGLLERLDLVPAERVIAVPGNHDVDWSAAPSTPGKFASYLSATREQALRTPYCDGVDDVEGANPEAAQPILLLDDVLIVAVNSANWCGTTVDFGGGMTKTFDIARVSESQLAHLTDDLRAHQAFGGVRVAVLHHHLLPVSEDEEAKHFESVTNLARLRSWLRLHGFHLALHGHKHHSALIWDHIYDLTGEGAPRRVLVSSAPSPSSWGQPIGRILRVGEPTGRRHVAAAPRITVATIVGQRPERNDEPDDVPFLLDPGTPDGPGLVAIDAESSDAAYEQLLDCLDRREGTFLNVVCVVRNAESAENLPTNFDSEKIKDSAEWLADAVSWWQMPAPALVAGRAAPFNHGERLYGTGRRQGPLDAAAERLGSTRAMAVLITNEELRSASGTPAFVAVQLVKVRHGATKSRLDCVGYFRKQDLPHWWPVNIAELRAIQKRVLDLRMDDDLEAGRLVTIAAEGVTDAVMPELSGTTIDRSVDLRPELLMEMAYKAAHGPLELEERDRVHALWARVLGDIGEIGNGDFPSLGIRRLIDHLTVFREIGRRNEVDELIKRLEAVYDRAHRATRDSRTQTDRKRFSRELFTLTGEVLEAVELALSDPQVPPSTT